MGSREQGYTDVFQKFIVSLSGKSERQVYTDVLNKKVDYYGEDVVLKGVIENLLGDGLNLYFNTPVDIVESGYFLGVTGDWDLKLSKTGFLYAKYLIEEGYFRNKIVDYSKFIYEREQNFKNWADDLNNVKFFHILTSEQNFSSLFSLVEYLEGICNSPKDYFKIYTSYDIVNKKLDIYDGDSIKDFSGDNYIVFWDTLDRLISLYKSGKLRYLEHGNFMETVDLINNDFIFKVNELADNLAEEKSKIN